jgi:TolB-like protein/Tfp pilus assembly protein PilF
VTDIFLSYNRKDQEVASRLADAFAARGVSVWWDATLRTGEVYDEVTEAALRNAKAVVVLWSSRSVGSRWVRSEATLALRQGTLMPVMIEPCERPVMFELTQTTDLTDWRGNDDDPAWQAFFRDVLERIGKPIPAPPPVELARSVALWLPRKPSVAVLPFADLGGGDDDFFADGMVEEISTVLSRFSTLFVIAGQSGLSFRDSRKSAKEIGRELGVRYLLEGSVRKAGGRVRVAVKLVDSSAGEQIWAERFDEKLDDVFELQDRIAWSVASTIDVTLQETEIHRAVKRPTGSLDAYELCLRADGALNRYNRDSVLQAIAFAEQAMALDPDYAIAIALAAFAHGVLWMNGWADDPDGTRRAALELGDRALSLGRDDEVSLTSIGAMLMNAGGDLAMARRLIDRALAINPARAYSLFWGGWSELESGFPDKGLERFERSVRISPRSMYRPFQLTGIGNCLFFLDRFDEAAEMQREALRLVPAYPAAHAILVASLVRAGRADEAAAAMAGLQAAGGLQLSLRYFRNAEQRKRVRAALEVIDSPAEQVA